MVFHIVQYLSGRRKMLTEQYPPGLVTSLLRRYVGQCEQGEEVFLTIDSKQLLPWNSAPTTCVGSIRLNHKAQVAA